VRNVLFAIYRLPANDLDCHARGNAHPLHAIEQQAQGGAPRHRSLPTVALDEDSFRVKRLKRTFLHCRLQVTKA
jgi:hypothetical protein